jgi:2,4-dienoyl-CoA reductase-like NADH-dependent reductase (Old Yellow Enzyme family)
LIDVARHFDVTRKIKDAARERLIVVGSGYSYLQEFLPVVAQHNVRENWTDLVGMGRMTLSYPGLFSDVLESGTINPKVICRTFSDCTTAPRNGLKSGCYPLDKFYTSKPEFQELKRIKKAMGV